MKNRRVCLCLLLIAAGALFLPACSTPTAAILPPGAGATYAPSTAAPIAPAASPTQPANSTAPLPPSATPPAPTDAPPTQTETPQPSPTPVPTLGAGSVMISAADLRPMVLVPAGSFPMGAGENDPNADPDEHPQHAVTVDAFWIDQYEVTHADYAACMQAGACDAPAEKDNNGWEAAVASLIQDSPVVNITWYNARDYCAWANKRLPTEAEWEKAARGDDGRIYPWGDDADAQGRAWYGGVFDASNPEVRDDFSRPAPVGSFPDGASPYGIYDMAGNVLEWVYDWYADNYSQDSGPNPTGAAEGAYRVVRGGSWTGSVLDLRSTYRQARGPLTTWIDVGFRCALPAEGADLLQVGQPTITPTPTNTPTVTPTPRPHYTLTPTLTPTAATPTALPASLPLYTLVFAGEDGIIYTVKSDGSSLTPITDGSVPYSSPAWSPAANLLAAFGPQEDGLGQSIWLMAPDGGKVRKLFDLPVGPQQFGTRSYDVQGYDWLGGLQWSPDGSRLAFQSFTGLGNAGASFNLHVISSSGSGFATSLFAFHPTWSPSNNQVAFVDTTPNLDEFTIARAHVALTGESITLAGMPGSQGGWLEPDWSPDGRNVAYVRVGSWDAPHDSLVIVNVDDTRRQVIYPGSGESAWVGLPTWSPAGDEIAFIGNEGALYAILPNGSGLRLITDGIKGLVQSMAWSPDGTRLALSTYEQDLYVVNADGSGLIVVATGLEPIYDLDWRSSLNGPPQWSAWPLSP